jgi:hypothetical protein
MFYFDINAGVAIAIIVSNDLAFGSGAVPVLVRRSSLPQAAVASKKLNSRNKAMLRWRMVLSPLEQFK